MSNSANVYCWSFSSNINEALHDGKMYGAKKFYGNEQLVLNFTSSLASTVQVDIWGYAQSVLEQSANDIKIYAL